MAARRVLHFPRMPHAQLLRQESIPIVPKRAEPMPQVLGIVISLRAMCCKYWLEVVQFILRRDSGKPQLMALHRYLTQLPIKLRTYIIHNGLRAGGLHFSHGLRELSAVNKSLVFLTSEVNIFHDVFLTFPKSGPEGINCPSDVELLLRYGEGLKKVTITFPIMFNDAVRKLFSDFCRTCKKMTHVTLQLATDDAVTVVTRHLRQLAFLNVSGSPGVTDEGLSRAIVNLRWGEGELPIKHIDVGGTSVTQDGMVNLITRLPTLTSLGSSDVVEVLQIMEEVIGSETPKTLLKETILKCTTINRLKTLRRLCPNLVSITATFQETTGATINDLKLLPELTHIKLNVREPFLLTPKILYDHAWAIGAKLETLRLAGDIYWEADLALLAIHCPNLKELALPAVTFPTRESLIVLEASDTLPLSNLQVLELDCMTGVGPKAWAKDFNLARRGLVISLRRCKKLQRLMMRPTCLVDTDILDILSYNRLLKLEVMELYQCAVGLATTRTIIDTCIELHVMKGLRTWRGITMNDLVLLRKYSRGHRRAAELKVLP